MKDQKSQQDLRQQLIKKPIIEQQRTLTCMQKFQEIILKKVQTCNRTIYFSGHVIPQNNQTNLVKNTKYNLITFIPLVLYNQFKYFFNLFFLITALTQLFDVLKVGLFFTFMEPLIFVLSLTMAKQGYDDYRTYLRDIQANSKEYDVITNNGIEKVKSKGLKVGDIVKIRGSDRVPADIVILSVDNAEGTLFIKTDQLDGETDWKLRKSIKTTQNIFQQETAQKNILNYNLKCELKPPCESIYNFQGLLVSQYSKQKITVENTMWTSIVVTNGVAIEFPLCIGKETIIALGASVSRTKVGILSFSIYDIKYISSINIQRLFSKSCHQEIFSITQLTLLEINFFSLSYTQSPFFAHILPHFFNIIVKLCSWYFSINTPMIFKGCHLHLLKRRWQLFS